MRTFLLRRLASLLGFAGAVAPFSGASPLPAPALAAAAEPASEVAAVQAQLEGSVQLVVFETDDCVYCNLFRRHVLPAYVASPRSRAVPLRFVDLNAPDAGRVGLDAPVDMLPTAVLLRNNREVGRIPGYVAPESFFHAVNHLMSQIE